MPPSNRKGPNDAAVVRLLATRGDGMALGMAEEAVFEEFKAGATMADGGSVTRENE
jgi:hypothetical protein